MKYLSIVIVALIYNWTAIAQPETIFEKANELYNQEKYQEAITAYLSIIEQGQASESVYYNLGNAYYKMSNIGPSIFYYEKALTLAPNDADIKNNLAFAKNATVDAIDIMPESIVTRIFNGLVNLFSFDTWAWISILGIILFVILFILYYYAQLSTKKRLFFITSWIAFSIALGSVFLAFKQHDLVTNTQYAIVFAQETTIKSEPNLRSEVIFELHEGTKVEIKEAVNDWRKIKLADGKIGWIPVADIKVL